jgi:hypothetical protein
MEVGRNLGWEPILMEIGLALIIGLAVACVVFILGRAFVGSGTARDQMQHQPGLSISASADRPGAASDTAKSIVAETETAPTAEPVPDHQAVTKASRKARKPSAARSQGDVAKRPPRRRQKTNTPTAPATDEEAPAATGVSPGVPAALDPR